MTGRELAAAVRPLEDWALAIVRFRDLAKDAIQLETKLSGIDLAKKELTTLQGQVTAGRETLTALRAEIEAAEATLAEERRAALAAIEREQAERVAAAEAQVQAQQAALETWQSKTRQAEMQHTARLATLRAEESAVQEHIDGLRDLAKRLAQAAAAVR